jgi:uncharacterized protein YlxW (UPF0749 family)
MNLGKMFANWKIFTKPYALVEEYVPDNNCSRKWTGFIFFIILGFITSFSLITKVEGNSTINSDNIINGLKIQKIQQDIAAIEKNNAILESEVFILNYNLAQMIQNQEEKELLKLSKLTGTHKEIGSGVIIKLTDSDKPVKPSENPNIGLIHNTDLLEIINNLWTGKAIAISLNNERITAKTGIRCVGPTILVNKTRIVPPFTIKAIGNPKSLAESVKKGSLEALKLSGIIYSIEKYNKLEIPADDNIILAGDF